MEYKKTYNREEIEELMEWFNKYKSRLPKSLQLDPAICIPNLSQTIEAYMTIAEKHYKNTTYGAQIHHLFSIKDKLITDNLLLPE